MCGIVGYIGNKEAWPVLVKGLERLEYRGYDSAGVAILHGGNFSVYKKKGRVAELSKFVKNENKENIFGGVGIAHTRWATHGEPSDRNAHPHLSSGGDIVIVHNGIIENYLSIKKILTEKGYKFISDTDTEVLANLIEDIKKNARVNIDEAVRLALKQVVGAYAIIVLSKDDPNTMVIAKVGSPVVIGMGRGEFFVASDATPIVEYTKKVVYLEDREMAIIKNKKLTIKTIDNKIKNPYFQKLQMKIDELEKGGFPHFMLKEIFDQPRSIEDSMRGRINIKNAVVKLGGIENYLDKLVNAKRILIIACGTSWHAGLEAKYFFEEFSLIPVGVEYASEFRYRNPVIYKDDIVIVISQSGETADTLAALQLAKEKGATVLGICNVVGASIPRATDAGIYTHAGPEIGVASTKAFTAQITALLLLCLCLAKEKNILNKKRMKELLTELEKIPKKVKEVLKVDEVVKKIAKEFKNAKNFIFLGRGYGFPLALEGALKLKEISYIHAEGFAMGEMKHGSIALVDENMPVVFIATKGPLYEKVVSNMMEVKARKGKIIAILSKGDKNIKKIADYVIEIPETSDVMMPFIASIPLQLLAYYVALFRGCDIDKPRNLAKSVTVE
ncbi:glutamine--fructose-6-phosphate aminotransferase [Candidatus Nomurabacteria bacterium RIFCSPHIGHO2_01_FULL_37_25]|uniref:Glutamine--fructose-6-phosphate aminotransferase [isomerizing] n=1 Tax=Candidatus Nomurabacteria bacterium RIFCSPLOWO2_01_FULL_36_16 TaxID=1801767 RepID=A0A1F6WZL5_9BACT|nr:MAG: glutamine--fructose-6-phosphate aminotransferase [Candidatus Nomurabacteria bacterium RIFCSPHIGHO2_01_FULL_37_25]OGI75459.1 MAG: glutamine--fructose-6-phosphate aminotransferase [Candidatus Nomurabacteria bacterium RIFCSPHIGHO2_02_FULL_36_29]OGI87298.1 MAG: glutamine--fructose-6-phosphate aminotransferase [Candidatus Nomurabacteria bacterium RIFCSPLOWO2_01_FULL_36_16]OGI95668.1 MAG: glutamine--fructose-6-phosphate aminotransferase [Candidatus Nomurabacteria bacterium RIFCSPLOWO2_02_FULL_